MRFLEICWRFLLLGCTSFGGPAAHVGYFRTVFVERLQWLDDETYGRLFALSQFLPGPGSSQLGFAIGCHRFGTLGGLGAFIGFTVPSFIIMFLLAISSEGGTRPPAFEGALHGLKLLAVVVVVDATLGMYRSFCKDRFTGALCVATASVLLVLPGMASQFGALLAGAFAGVFFLRPKSGDIPPNITKPRLRAAPLVVFALLFIGCPLVAGTSDWVRLFSGFYQAGSLVFGGGHVVLPLLQSHSVSSAIDEHQFVVGYAAAQGVPGPMFTLATFLGAKWSPDTPLTGSIIATLAVFLPGFLLVLGLKDAWHAVVAAPKLNGAAKGLNASVVGLLVAACYRPVFTSSVYAPLDFALVVIGFYMLRSLKLPVLAIVLGFAATGALREIYQASVH